LKKFNYFKNILIAPMNPLIQDNNGIRYIFGYLDKNKEWCFPPHLFHLMEQPSSTIDGQYLTSTWFAYLYPKNTIQRYMILGIKGTIHYSNITRFINDNDGDWSANALRTYNDEQNIVFQDYYEIIASKTTSLIEDCDSDESKQINIGGIINGSCLTLRIRLHNGGLYTTLPSFVWASPDL